MECKLCKYETDAEEFCPECAPAWEFVCDSLNTGVVPGDCLPQAIREIKRNIESLSEEKISMKLAACIVFQILHTIEERARNGL